MLEDLNELFEKDYLNEIYKQKPEDQTMEDYIKRIISPEEKVEERRGKIITRWRFFRHLEKPITPEIMRKLDNTEKIHKIRFNYTYKLRNIENEATMDYFKESKTSPWFERLSETEGWIAQEEEEKRLRGENIETPNTKWAFEE